MVSGRTSGTSAGSRKNRATPGSSAATPARTDENMPSSKPGLATAARAGARGDGRHLVAAMPRHDDDVVDTGAGEGADRPLEQRAPLDLEQRLELAHARGATGREDDRREPLHAQASAPDRTWTISATMLTASSAGVSAPIDRPMGEWIRAMASSPKPASRSAACMRARLERLAMTPT